ncbi:MAG: hypothetical protein FI699_06065 [SAR202 cluster bacterium]|nr:hypothetical protein [Chloroflexota bacterium]MQG88418.1 hypothetical protein [SAR202 cluster bacterium]|tara:strand:- start:3175 stop:3558 length:384 start_codon:yes stop_codon:yes gene_type:complete
MPYQNDLLINSERVALAIMLNRLIPFDDSDLKPSNLKITDSLSLDIMSSALGRFAALTKDEQTESILEIEKSLPEEINVVLGITPKIYYENTKTPGIPSHFNYENEIFGKVLSELHSSNRPRNVKGR